MIITRCNGGEQEDNAVPSEFKGFRLCVGSGVQLNPGI